MTLAPQLFKRATMGEDVPTTFSIQTWNAMVRAGENNGVRTDLRLQQLEPVSNTHAHEVRIENAMGGQLEKGDIVVPSRPLILPSDSVQFITPESLVVRVRSITANDHGLFLICRDPLPDNAQGIAYAGGIVPVKVEFPVDGSWITRCDIDVYAIDKTRLIADPRGSALIYYAETTTPGVKDCLVWMNAPGFYSLPGKAVGSTLAAPTQAGEVEIWQKGGNTNYVISNVWLDWMHGGQGISADKEVIIDWFPDEKIWRVTHAECEDADGSWFDHGDV